MVGVARARAISTENEVSVGQDRAAHRSHVFENRLIELITPQICSQMMRI